MNIYELKQRTNILSQLLEIWEDSVRATHHFLSDAEVNQIKKYVPQALTGVKHLPLFIVCATGFHWIWMYTMQPNGRVSQNYVINLY